MAGQGCGVCKAQTLELLQPDDYHHHFRDDPYLEHTVPHAARAFSRVIAMPNLVPPVTTVDQALAYRERIMARVPADVPEGSFVPLMTLYMTDNLTPDEVRKAVACEHVHAIKLYPAGATTNSDFGITDYEKIGPALATMEELGLLLLIHGESTDQSVDVFEREQSFYETTLPSVIGKFPKLRVVCEHITSAVAARWVQSQGPNIAATITAHHLLHNRNHIFAGGINPHMYCLPILKREDDRQVLLECASSGSPKFFLGTDSAPHTLERKECACGCAGCFTAHAAVEFVAEAFEAVGKLEALEGFVSRHGAEFYGLEVSTEKRRILKETWTVPDTLSFGPSVVRPLRAGKPVTWRLLPRD